MKKLVVAPISNTIYYATVNEKNHTMNPNTRIDMTNNAIASVFEWFMNQMEGKEEFSIRYPSTEFELVMRRTSDRKEILTNTEVGGQYDKL